MYQRIKLCLRCSVAVFFSFWFLSCSPEGQQHAVLNASSADRTARIGAFNLLRLGYGEKNLRRMSRLIDRGDYDAFAAVEVMRPDAAWHLLEHLNEQRHSSWQLELSESPTGESSYKEYVAFYYRSDRVSLLDDADLFCSTELARQVASTSASCYANDRYLDGEPDFERDPYVGQFKIGSEAYALIGVHLLYGNRSRERVARRQYEMLRLLDVMMDVRRESLGLRVVALGDFNLKLDNSTREQVPLEFLNGGDPGAVVGLIDEPTTVGSSNFDHLFYFDEAYDTLAVLQAEVVVDFDVDSKMERDLYKKEVSDHYPVVAEFLAH